MHVPEKHSKEQQVPGPGNNREADVTSNQEGPLSLFSVLEYLPAGNLHRGLSGLQFWRLGTPEHGAGISLLHHNVGRVSRGKMEQASLVFLNFIFIYLFFSSTGV
jgi:hypothetical protein